MNGPLHMVEVIRDTSPPFCINCIVNIFAFDGCSTKCMINFLPFFLLIYFFFGFLIFFVGFYGVFSSMPLLETSLVQVFLCGQNSRHPPCFNSADAAGETPSLSCNICQISTCVFPLWRLACIRFDDVYTLFEFPVETLVAACKSAHFQVETLKWTLLETS